MRAGRYRFVTRIPFGAAERGFEPNNFHYRMRALLGQIPDGASGVVVLDPAVDPNPIAVVIEKTIGGDRRYAIVTTILRVSRVTDFALAVYNGLVATAFREAGAGSHIDAFSLAREIETISTALPEMGGNVSPDTSLPWWSIGSREVMRTARNLPHPNEPRPIGPGPGLPAPPVPPDSQMMPPPGEGGGGDNNMLTYSLVGIGTVGLLAAGVAIYYQYASPPGKRKH